MKQKSLKKKFNFKTNEGRTQISLASAMLLGVAWLLGIQFQSGELLSTYGITGWLISLFLIPLMLMLSINFKFKWAFLASIGYGALYLTFSAGTLIFIENIGCCILQASIISVFGAILGLTIIYFSYNTHKELKIKW